MDQLLQDVSEVQRGHGIGQAYQHVKHLERGLGGGVEVHTLTQT